MAGDRWGWFDSAGRMDLFKTWNIALYNAFRRHGLDLLLIGSDKSAMPDEAMEVQKWVADNMDDWLGAYVTHWYVYGYPVDRLDMWETYHKQFEGQVQLALSKGKRYILGEYGYCPVFGGKGVMIDDVGASFRQKETAAESALCKCEVGLAAMNAGAYGCISWSFLDYPDPFNREDGNSEMDHARYEAGLCAYRPDLKYNKWGMIHWSDVDRDYSATPELYSLGYLAKFFRKGATVLKCASDNPLVRTGAVIYPDRSFCIALINRGEATDVTVDCSSWALDPKNDTFSKSARRYVYEAANPPFNEFKDLQPCSGTVTAKDGKLTVKLPAHSMTFLTTDYTDRTPSRIGGVKVKDGKLVWNPCADKEHRYYRVFRDGKQIASTVATELALNSAGGNFTVKSVDAWGNVGD